MFLKEAINTKQRVKLFALVTEPKSLLYQNPYQKDAEPEIIMQQLTENGSRIYDVPYIMAQRLLAAEPYKYFLCEPTSIRCIVSTAKGGTEIKMFTRFIEKKENGKIVKDSRGLPELINGLNDEDKEIKKNESEYLKETSKK